MDNIGNNMDDDDENDEDLEAELAALAAGNNTGYKSRRTGKLIKCYTISIVNISA